VTPAAVEVGSLVRCSRCDAALPPEVIEARGTAMCPACGADVLVRVFPAFLAKPEVIVPSEIAAAEGEATCFFHSGKTAAHACAKCGRFLCRLCQMELHGEVLCPECITSGISKKRFASLENRRVCYDTVALATAVLPVLFTWYFTCLTAPAALYIAIRYWRAPSSILGRTKLRMILAILIAAAEIAVWTWFIAYWISQIGTKG